MPDGSAFVLVHGGRHGGWWQRVARALSRSGHQVHRPTLTGLGEWAHLLSRDIGLVTHIADVTAVFEYEELQDVILVAHSYGASGPPVFDVIGPDRAAVLTQACEQYGEGCVASPARGTGSGCWTHPTTP